MKKQIDIKKIREAIANYIQSEGCGCCEGYSHYEDIKVLANLLNVPMYKDKSGYDFSFSLGLEAN